MAIDYDLQPGQMVGEYRVERKIGEGGFGKVYAAVHPVIGKAAAIKILNPELAKNEQMVSRFVSEARAVNQIRHRNIIDIFAFGTLPSGLHYFVMEMLEGQPLDAYLEKNGPLEVGHALSLLWPIGRALVAAHKAGITHRDLKPENVFLTFDEDGGIFPKLLDFGIAKLVHEAEMAHRTRTGAMMGTPIYMSPEQCRGSQIDHRSDIYSFGIMVHEVLTGSRPFTGDSLMDLLMKQVSAPAPPMSASRPDLPRSLDVAVLHMLEKSPDRRPESMQAALDELARGAEAAGIPVPASAHVVPMSRASASGAAGQRPSATPATANPGGAALDTNAWLNKQAGMPTAGPSMAVQARTGPGAGQTPAPGPVAGQSPSYPQIQGAPPPAQGWQGNAQPAYNQPPQGYPPAAPGGPTLQSAGMGPAPGTAAAPRKKPASAVGIVAAIVAGVFFLFVVGFIALVAVASGDGDTVQLAAHPPDIGAPIERQVTSDLLMKLTPAGAQVPVGSSTVRSHRRYQVTPLSVGSERALRAEIRYSEDVVTTRLDDGTEENENNPTANRAFSVVSNGGTLTVSSTDGAAMDDVARRSVLRDAGPFFDAVPAMFNHQLKDGDALTPSSDTVIALLGLGEPDEGIKVRADNASFKLRSIDNGDDTATFDVTFLYVYDDEHIHISAPITGKVTFDTTTGMVQKASLSGPIQGTFANEKGRMGVSGTVAMESR